MVLPENGPAVIRISPKAQWAPKADCSNNASVRKFRSQIDIPSEFRPHKFDLSEREDNCCCVWATANGATSPVSLNEHASAAIQMARRGRLFALFRSPSTKP
jgi:hypothetical protein